MFWTDVQFFLPRKYRFSFYRPLYFNFTYCSCCIETSSWPTRLVCLCTTRPNVSHEEEVEDTSFGNLELLYKSQQSLFVAGA